MPHIRRHIDLPTISKAVTLIQEGHLHRSVALQLGYSRGAIQNVWNHFQEAGTLSRGQGSGGVRATTAKQDRYVRLTARREQFITAHCIQNRLWQATGTSRVSHQTIKNRLHEDQQFSRRRVVRITLTSAHRANRLSYVRQYLDWDISDWSTMLFTDQIKVIFLMMTGMVWRREGERSSNVCIRVCDRFRGADVMMWGGISLSGRTEQLN